MMQLREIDSPVMPRVRSSDKHLQRAHGLCRIVVSGSERGNEVVDVFHQSPLKVIFPKIDGADLKEAVLINTAGGIAGGDQLKCDVMAMANASIAVTSQTAERVYRSLDEPARVFTKLKVTDGARLAWFPQETMIFNWARLHRETEIEVSSGAEMLALEWLVFGRAAHGEQILGGQLSDRCRVKKDGRLIWVDTFHVGEEMFPHLTRSALLSNCKAIATLVYYSAEPDERIEVVRQICSSLECLCGATSISGLIIVRLAAETSSILKLALRTLLNQVGSEFGPGPFRVPKMWSC